MPRALHYAFLKRFCTFMIGIYPTKPLAFIGNYLTLNIHFN